MPKGDRHGHRKKASKQSKKLRQANDNRHWAKVTKVSNGARQAVGSKVPHSLELLDQSLNFSIGLPFYRAFKSEMGRAVNARLVWIGPGSGGEFAYIFNMLLASYNGSARLVEVLESQREPLRRRMLALGGVEHTPDTFVVPGQTHHFSWRVSIEIADALVLDDAAHIDVFGRPASHVYTFAGGNNHSVAMKAVASAWAVGARVIMPTRMWTAAGFKRVRPRGEPLGLTLMGSRNSFTLAGVDRPAVWPPLAEKDRVHGRWRAHLDSPADRKAVYPGCIARVHPGGIYVDVLYDDGDEDLRTFVWLASHVDVPAC